MQTDKIEITWTLMPANENPLFDNNEFAFRIKCKDFDIADKFFINPDVISNEVALSCIMWDLMNNKEREDDDA